MKKISFVLVAATFLIAINTVSAATSIETSDVTFATLNTNVNGDQPNHLIDATITDGKYKGARLHGKLVTTKGKTGNPDRINLYFTSMNIDDKSKPSEITAYAIDANTAHTALNGKVSSEYLQHNGLILAASFVQSYAQNGNQSLPGYSKNSYPVKINAGTDIGILFTSKLA